MAAAAAAAASQFVCVSFAIDKTSEIGTLDAIGSGYVMYLVRTSHNFISIPFLCKPKFKSSSRPYVYLQYFDVSSFRAILCIICSECEFNSKCDTK